MLLAGTYLPESECLTAARKNGLPKASAGDSWVFFPKILPGLPDGIFPRKPARTQFHWRGMVFCDRRNAGAGDAKTISTRGNCPSKGVHNSLNTNAARILEPLILPHQSRADAPSIRPGEDIDASPIFARGAAH